MNLLTITLLSAAVLLVAYRLYGGLLVRLLKLDPDRVTPAVELRDDVDYQPIEKKFLLGQHFSAIAAAGPIVGPILAGVMFGWGPALIWILLGSIFIGGVHDITALVASLRHGARSITEVVRQHMSQRSYLLFLVFIWIALVYIIVAFTDTVASSFVGTQDLTRDASSAADAVARDGGGERTLTVEGAAIAGSSLIYLALPILMGLLLRYTRLTLGWATVIFLPLVGLSIYAGPYVPLDLAYLLEIGEADARRVWNVLLLVYCFLAAIAPMWLLLQPRGHLGGYFLYFALAGGVIGILFGGHDIQYPAFTGWSWVDPKGRSQGMFPMLFITIACGACSGFHSIIASGTTSKQLRKETDAKVIGYGAMLLEGMVAVVSVACVMILARPAAEGLIGKPNFIYAQGIGAFLGTLGVPAAFGISFGLLAFTTFVYDTLDVCTRLGRYIIQELTGWTGVRGRVATTAVMAAVPLLFLLDQQFDGEGKVIPVWRIYWALFGASNQLLAALSLMGVTVWLWRTRREKWVWLVTGLPAAWMYVVSVWALGLFVRKGFFTAEPTYGDPVPWVATILIALAGLLLIEAIRVFLRDVPPTTPHPEPVAA